jgi:hypothetical protein
MNDREWAEVWFERTKDAFEEAIDQRRGVDAEALLRAMDRLRRRRDALRDADVVAQTHTVRMWSPR